MIDISVNEVTKAFTVGQDVLCGLSFDVNSGEHVGILGQNGSGKTTLFKILTGELTADTGTVSIAAGRRLGVVSQLPNYPAGVTTEDVLRDAQRRLRAMAKRMTELEGIMSRDSGSIVMSEYDRLSENFRLQGGYDMDFERSRVANGLDIDADMRKRPFELLSGGERTRVNLARLILEDADILLLDEPTNHLDIEAAEWLQDYITRYKGTVLTISHDRSFLDAIAHRCIEISEGKAELFSGNYSFYTVERQRRFDEKLKQYEKDQEKIAQLQEAAARLHLWAFMGNDKLHKRAFSMEKRIERLSRTKKPKTARKLKVSFKEREFKGDEVLFAADVKKGFGDCGLFEIPELIVEQGERIALIGPNGSGKTTLIKIIMGEELPDEGFFRPGPQVKAAYLPQIIKFEDKTRSAMDTLMYDSGASPQQARDSLAAFGFVGEDVFKSVGTLSGGEQSRLRLCMLMRGDINLLILDEPTNHLDLASREWIEDCVSDYGETLIFVSHDRFFIEKFANRIWSIENGCFSDYRGSYAEYREHRRRMVSTERAEKKRSQTREKTAKARQPSTQKLLERKEKEIEKLESELEALEAAAEKHGSDYKRLMEIEEERAGLSEKLDVLYDEWEELHEQQ